MRLTVLAHIYFILISFQDIKGEKPSKCMSLCPNNGGRQMLLVAIHTEVLARCWTVLQRKRWTPCLSHKPENPKLLTVKSGEEWQQYFPLDWRNRPRERREMGVDWWKWLECHSLGDRANSAAKWLHEWGLPSDIRPKYSSRWMEWPKMQYSAKFCLQPTYLSRFSFQQQYTQCMVWTKSNTNEWPEGIGYALKCENSCWQHVLSCMLYMCVDHDDGKFLMEWSMVLVRVLLESMVFNMFLQVNHCYRWFLAFYPLVLMVSPMGQRKMINHWSVLSVRRPSKPHGAAPPNPIALCLETPAPPLQTPSRCASKPQVRRASKPLGTKFETKIFKFRWFLGPSDQNELYHTPLLSKIWDLGNRKIFGGGSL